jgi:hypothetical protein
MPGSLGLNLAPWRWVGLSVALVLLLPRTSLADKPRECAEAYEAAQVERKAGHITAAIEKLTVCSAEACPKFIRKDCIQWLTESQSAQPSVVFSVRHRGADLSAVEISCDGRVVARTADGKAVAIDPGPHVFVFRAPGLSPLEKQLIVREGERNRLVEAVLTERIAREPASTALPEATLSSSEMGSVSPGPNSTNLALRTYGLAGLGILGVSGFAAFGLLGNSQKHDLESSCSPFCSSSQVDEVRTKYIVADACLAVGVVSLGLATYWFVTGQPPQSTAPATSVAVSPLVGGRGGVVNISSSF